MKRKEDATDIKSTPCKIHREIKNNVGAKEMVPRFFGGRGTQTSCLAAYEVIRSPKVTGNQALPGVWNSVGSLEIH